MFLLQSSLIGESLGPYKILKPLGAGGMGEVYLGEDTRLGRKVAIKVLPAEFASDPERLARFDQEARAAAALNHPHIAVVHDIGSEGSTHFMVQEYLQGQSLRERLEKGALPVDQALDLAIEVGEALTAAHKAGIIHRDLKPDNIFVTEEGHAKVLDFGLAKLKEAAAPAGSDLSVSPTLLGTVAGQIVGTAGYMAPEQVEGGYIDHRTDGFAFGCVLYEMATGRQAFAGENRHASLAKILSEQPPAITETNPALPGELRRIVDKALAKPPERRYQSTEDLVVDLRALARASESGTLESTAGLKTPAAGRSWVAVALPVVGAAVLGAVVTWAGMQTSESLPTPAKLAIDVSVDYISTGAHRVFAISPDDESLVFRRDGQLWLRRMRDGVISPIPGTEGGAQPFFSPDGQRLGFVVDGELRRVVVTGGAPRTLCPVEIVQGATWADDGYIYFGADVNGVMRVSEEGGDAEALFSLESGQRAHGAQPVAGGEWVLFTLRGQGASWFESEIVVQSMTSSDRKQLGLQGTDARWLDTGHILFVRDSILHAARFDVDQVAVVGTPVPVADDVRQSTGTSGDAQYAVSARGSLLYVAGQGTGGLAGPVWRPRRDDGVEALLDGALVNPQYPDLSPDGTRLALAVDDQLWVYFLDGRPPIPLTPRGGIGNSLWTPDSERLLFERTGGFILMVKADGSSAAPVPVAGIEGGHNHPLAWAPDGRLIFVETGQNTGETQDLWMVPLDGSDAPEALLASEHNEGLKGVAVSPNGRYFAYVSDRSGVDEIWVSDFPGGEPIRVSLGGAAQPRWAPDGSELYFLRGSTIFAARFDEANQRFAAPLEVFDAPRLIPTDFDSSPVYDVAADGRFLIIEAAENSGGADIKIVLNWLEELKERVPTGG